MRQRNDLKVLHLEIRADVPTQERERGAFLGYGRLEPGQMTTVNVFEAPDFDSSVIEGMDALFIGGSSDVEVMDGAEALPWLPAAYKLLQRCYDEKIPVLASCFGYQMAIEAFGGVLAKDPDFAEDRASLKIWLTDEGKEDALFNDMEDPFWAVSIHKYSATTLPEGAIVLARSERYPYHAIRLGDRPFYATQFHTEIDGPDILDRISWYRDRYWKDDDEGYQKVVDSVQDMSAINAVIGTFIDRIVLNDV